MEDVYTSVYAIYIDIAPKFSFHREVSDFSGQPFSPSSLGRLSFIIPLPPPTLPPVPRRSLYQTKQSRSRGRRVAPFPSERVWGRLLGDNLYTTTTYVITYSLDTSFPRARRDVFHGFVPARRACYREDRIVARPNEAKHSERNSRARKKIAKAARFGPRSLLPPLTINASFRARSFAN